MGHAVPACDAALRLLREHFLNRTDLLAIQAPWGKPCPVEVGGLLDELLLGHLLGGEAPEAQVHYANRRGSGTLMGRFRVGSYCPGPDDTTRWLCLDFDGAGHAEALADPLAATLAAYEAFTAAGLPAFLERSGGGKGWHLWCFFEPPLPAVKAQALGRALAPRNAPLANGVGRVADPRSARGIEVFPKQPRVRRGGLGNLVWLPWWQGAAEGGNTFYRRGEDGALQPYAPRQFVPADLAVVERTLLAHAPPPPVRSLPPRGRRAPSAPTPAPSASDTLWGEWRRKALSALPLEAIYGEWLTGKPAGSGWLECRDPASATGDQHPSASVADGTGEAERGTFHSFISGRTLSVFDFLVEQGGTAHFREARTRVAQLSGVPEPSQGPKAGATSVSTPPRPGKPKIVIRTQEHEVVDEAIAALAHVEGVFCRGHLLVHVVRERSKLAGIIHPGGGARIVPLEPAGIRDRLTYAAEWVMLKEKQGEWDEVPAHPPAWAAPAVEARKHWPRVRCLEGITESPVLRPDGSLLERPGYDEATGLLYLPNARYPAAPAAPSQSEAHAALRELLEAVSDFPFKTDAHRAAWLAGVLTPLARYAFRGPAPLFLMDANVRGAGKSLLADVTGEIVSGRPMPRTPQALDEMEEVKRITAIALEGDRLVLIDNIHKPLGSGALDAVLTGTVWSERILGRSEKVSLPLFTVWYGTGNNVTFKGDTARRCLHIRLDSNLEKPESREGFKHPELLAWVHEHRSRLVVAALTALGGYCAAGRPAVGLRPWGSFEGWSALVRGAIVWAGLPDPEETRAELDEVDTEAHVLTALVAGWEELPDGLGARGCTIAQALEILRQDVEEKRFAQLRVALGELCPHPPGQLPVARKVGYALRRFRGRVVAGRKLQTRVAAGNNLWLVQHVGSPEAADPSSLAAPLNGVAASAAEHL